MDKIYVVFWTQGGNTQAMAEAIGEGIREAGKEAEVVFVTGANLDELKAAPKFALGCPAMGAEVLEESEMEPFVCDVEGFASGKKIALFGSYSFPFLLQAISRSLSSISAFEKIETPSGDE